MSGVKELTGGEGGGSGRGSRVSARGYDFSKSGKTVPSVTNTRFLFGPRDSRSVSVDQTLATLFDTLSVECSGVLVHPQWKHFRHICMLKNDRIRLSNGIWRSWHLQFLKMKRPLYCRFDIDPKLEHHKRQEAVVLEGKYWKRKFDAVATEYRKWRFYREKTVKKPDPSLNEVREKAAAIFYELTSDQKSQEMQVDPPMPPFLPFAEEFPEDKLYQKVSSNPYNDYSMMMQQPNLDMLNPMLHLDDFLSEPMPVDTFSVMGRPVMPSSIFVGDTMVSQSALTAFTSTHQMEKQLAPYTSPSPPPPPASRQQQLQQQQQQQEQQQIDQQQQVPAQLSPLHSNPQTPIQHSVHSVMQPEPYSSSSPFTFIDEYQQHSQQQQQTDPAQFMTILEEQGKVLEEEEGGGEEMLDIEMAGNINVAMKCESSLKDELSSSSQQQALQKGMYGIPLNFQQHSVMQTDIQHAASASGTGSGIDEQLYGQPQQQQIGGVDSSGLSSVLGQLYQKALISQQQQQQQQQHSLPMAMTSMTPTLTPCSITTHTSQGGQVGGSSMGRDFPYTTPSPLASPPGQLVKHRRPTPPITVAQFVRVPSAEELYGTTQSSRPPLERNRSEPIRQLQSKVTHLGAQYMKQMEELEKQQNLANIQYSEFLMQLMMNQQAKAKPSEEQKKILQNVLSDPSLVKMLRAALLTNHSLPDQQQQQNDPQQQQELISPLISSPPSTPIVAPVHLQPKKESGCELMPTHTPLTLAPAAVTGDSVEQQETSCNMLSPTQFAKMTGVSEFQSRLLMAAISQANPPGASPSTHMTFASSSSASATGFSPGAGMASSVVLASSEDTSPAQDILKKFKNARSLTSSEKEVYKEIRRQSHISAEQKRRGSIKNGFDQLQSLVINPTAYPSGKVSKAVILEKTLEHMKKAHTNCDRRTAEIVALKARIEELNAAIVVCQEKLPVSGAPVTRQRFEENRQRFKSYVQKRTLQNYKFWIFSIILQQLFDSYNSTVSIGTVDELCNTVLNWFEQNCTLPALRPIVMNSLKELSQKTSILSDPSKVPRQLTQYAQQSTQEQDLRTSRPCSLEQQTALDIPLYN